MQSTKENRAQDIKPENILLDSDWNVKLADFGIAKILEYDGDMGMTMAYSQEYGAPELFNKGKYDIFTQESWHTECLLGVSHSTPKSRGQPDSSSHSQAHSIHSSVRQSHECSIQYQEGANCRENRKGYAKAVPRPFEEHLVEVWMEDWIQPQPSPV